MRIFDTSKRAFIASHGKYNSHGQEHYVLNWVIVPLPFQNPLAFLPLARTLPLTLTLWH